jgi:hypothetical protein
MTEHGGGAGFAPEPFERLRVFDEGAMQHFNSDLIADMYATRAIDRSHSALAEQGDYLILGIEDLSYQRV